MHYTFFQIPAVDPDAVAKCFNAFIQSQSVINIERQFVADGLNSFWSICVTTALPGGSGLSNLATAKERTCIDYREVLTHIWPFRLRPSRRRRKHYRLALAHWQQQWRTGAINSLELQQAYAACQAILLPADDLAWRKHCLTRIERIDA